MNEPCRRAIDRFTGSLDDRLGTSESAFLESHLGDCALCRAEAREIAALHRDLMRLAVDTDQDRVTALLARVRWDEAANGRRRRRRRLPQVSEGRGAVAGVVAAAFLAGILLATLLSTGRRPVPETHVAAPEPLPSSSEIVREKDAPPPRQVFPETPRRLDDPPPRGRIAPPETPTAHTPPVTLPEPPPAAPRPEPVPATVSAVKAAANVETVTGSTAADGVAVQAGAVLVPGQSLSTTGGALLVLPDATRLYAGPDTTVRFTDGKTVHLLQGDLAADVTPQSKEDPCVFATPLADVRVFGTWLTISARPGSTHVEVEKGRVQVRRRRDGWTLDVREGNSAVICEGQAPRLRPLPPNLLVDAGFEADGKAWTGLYHPDGLNFGGISVQSKVTRSGSKSLEFVTNRTPGYDREVYQDFTVVPGDGVVAEGWLKTEKVGPQGVRAEILWLRAADGDVTSLLRTKGAILKEDVVGSLAGTADWTRVARRLTAPPQARAVRFVLYTDADLTGSGRAWFDDFRLRRFPK